LRIGGLPRTDGDCVGWALQRTIRSSADPMARSFDVLPAGRADRRSSPPSVDATPAGRAIVARSPIRPGVAPLTDGNAGRIVPGYAAVKSR
jgi:hypothetical protein